MRTSWRTVRRHYHVALQHVARLSAVVRPGELAGSAAPGGPGLDAQLLQQRETRQVASEVANWRLRLVTGAPCAEGMALRPILRAI